MPMLSLIQSLESRGRCIFGPFPMDFVKKSSDDFGDDHKNKSRELFEPHCCTRGLAPELRSFIQLCKLPHAYGVGPITMRYKPLYSSM